MSTIGDRDRARRLVLVVGVAVLGLTVALGVFIHLQRQDLGPPEDVPRAVAIPALYATMGLLAIIAAVQRRPLIAMAAGLLCLVGTILSAATIGFALPGLVLIMFGSRIGEVSGRRWAEPLIAAAVVLLVVGAAIAFLGMTEGRCWQAAGSPAGPTYTVIPCGGQGGSGGSAQGVYGGTAQGGGQGTIAVGGQTFAGGFDSGVMTMGGGLIEALLLLGALALTAVTGRTLMVAGAPLPAADQTPPP
jgi:hypothetical protein